MKTNRLFIRVISVLTSIVIAVLFIIFSCKKENSNLTVKGQVRDTILNVLLSGVKVDLYVQKIVSGTLNYNYVFDKTTNTDLQGNFSFSTPVAYATGYKVYFTKTDYFDISEIMQVSDFENSIHSEIYTMLPDAYLSVHIKNISPYDSSDMLKYHILNGTTHCSDCCGTDYSTFTGMTVDTIKTCRVIGARNDSLEWFITKGGNAIPFVKSYFCPAFQTTTVDIFY
ncbi:MAG: hypothetical protein NTW49_03555 [Bacteroidia bacterium]|nr:hypothetical protein [Bacteroidia bacterium]